MNHVLKDKVMYALKKKHKIKIIIRKLRFPFMRLRRRCLYDKVVNSQSINAVNNTTRDVKIIVSLTSYPKRFNSLPIVIKSLLMQTIMPDKIIIWYSCDSSYLTKEMKDYEKYGVEFVKVNQDLGPHKKYFYALQKYKEDIVIVVDDDLIYPLNLIESLIDTHRNNPDCVCARRVHKINIDEMGRIGNYDDWIRECYFENKPSHLLMATSGAGTLYPPNIFGKDVFDADAIRSMCLYGDDIWLKFFEIMCDVKVVWASNSMMMPPTVDNSQGDALSVENVDNNRNNVYILLMNKKYGSKITKILQKYNNHDIRSFVLEKIEILLGERISYWGEQ